MKEFWSRTSKERKEHDQEAVWTKVKHRHKINKEQKWHHMTVLNTNCEMH